MDANDIIMNDIIEKLLKNEAGQRCDIITYKSEVRLGAAAEAVLNFFQICGVCSVRKKVYNS